MKYEKVVYKTNEFFCLEISTYRLKVFGGWVVKEVSEGFGDNADSISICFVPDPNHEWKLEE